MVVVWIVCAFLSILISIIVSTIIYSKSLKKEDHFIDIIYEDDNCKNECDCNCVKDDNCKNVCNCIKDNDCDHWECEYFKENGCPYCGSHYFLEGPCGGLSMNIKCSKCGARFNVAGPFGVDLIEKPKNY